MKQKVRVIFMVTVFAIIANIFSAFTAKAIDTEDYIAAHVECAQDLMRENKLPASLILAVAIHESAAGNSKIARYLNNHFGVKGANNNTEIRSAYRDYDSAEDSYQDFVDLLENRQSFNYLFDVKDQYDYRGWARGIQRGGYAHSKTWASQVIAIIQKYQLYQYDERPADYVEPARTKPHLRKRVKSHIYIVKKGDNLNAIAKKKGTTVKLLMKKNALKTVDLQPGKKLKY